MARRKKSTERGSRNKKTRKPKQGSAAGRVASTPYGDIPLIERQITNAYGKVHRYFEYDLDYRPQVPVGAVRGEPRKQDFCQMCHAPRYFYVDEDKICVQCGDTFVFSGKEQKYWYEVLRFNFDSVAIRCLKCRKKKRTEKALANQIGVARTRLREDPNDPHALLDDAESCVRYFQRTGKGNLNRGIASARKARRVWPDAAEAYFWEGVAQYLAGRTEKSRVALEAFLERSGRLRKHRRAFRVEARQLIERISN